MKKVTVTLTCDPCTMWEDRENDAPDVQSVSIGPMELDACRQHREDMAAFVALWQRWGTMDGQPPQNGSSRSRRPRGGQRARQRREGQGGAPADA